MDRRRLLNISLAVGIADALLLVALLYVAVVDRNEDAISILGPIHGLGFVALLYLTGMGARDGHWGWWYPGIVLITGGPLGTLIGDVKIRREPSR